MSGRTENQIAIFKRVEEKIKRDPKYIVDWYFYLKANGASATTCRDYINKIHKFLMYINDDYSKVKINDLNKGIVIQYFAYIQNPNNNFSDSYRQSIWSCLNSFFKYLFTMELISENYLEQSHISRGKNRDLDRINRNRILLTREDFKKIIKAVKTGVGSSSSQKYQNRYKNRDICIFLIFMTTGIRETALREINVKDINFDTKILTVVDKGRKIHEYMLTDDIISYLQDWLTDRYFILGGIKNDALFISRNKTRISSNSIAELVDKYASEALGYHISPHKLRSGLASILYEEKHDLEYVRRVIGHSNITTTQRYVVTNNKEREEAANIISEILS